jgi:Zn-dependent protease with chaperone function
MPIPTDTTRRSPGPMPYHRAIVSHLRDREPELWNWFASTQKRLEQADAVRLDLLKSTYRLEPQAQPKLYELANAARQRLGLTCDITLYQAQTGNALNAALAYLPGEAHVILAGPLANVLAEPELQAVLAHELAHFLLYEADQGHYLIASDLLRALSADPVAGPAASESFRLYSLWTEVYADRWAHHVCGDVHAAVAALIKIETGLNEVSASSYLRQADEIFAKASETTSGISHPEPYIRARALRLWAEQGEQAQAEIERMIQGGLSLHRLDFLAQVRAADLTERFLQSLLAPRWYHTDTVLGHAKRFFAGFAIHPNSPRPLGEGLGVRDLDVLKTEMDSGDVSLRDYFCYLMLDFATVDRELGDVALSASIVLARRLGIDKRFAELAQKELGIGKKAFGKIDKEAENILAKTEAAEAS